MTYVSVSHVNKDRTTTIHRVWLDEQGVMQNDLPTEVWEELAQGIPNLDFETDPEKSVVLPEDKELFLRNIQYAMKGYWFASDVNQNGTTTPEVKDEKSS